ncbi:hypothetical protein CYMTET_47994, partial [Cymbomonas tetramitiformis]
VRLPRAGELAREWGALVLDEADFRASMLRAMLKVLNREEPEECSKESKGVARERRRFMEDKQRQLLAECLAQWNTRASAWATRRLSSWAAHNHRSQSLARKVLQGWREVCADVTSDEDDMDVLRNFTPPKSLSASATPAFVTPLALGKLVDAQVQSGGTARSTQSERAMGMSPRVKWERDGLSAREIEEWERRRRLSLDAKEREEMLRRERQRWVGKDGEAQVDGELSEDEEERERQERLVKLRIERERIVREREEKETVEAEIDHIRQERLDLQRRAAIERQRLDKERQADLTHQEIDEEESEETDQSSDSDDQSDGDSEGTNRLFDEFSSLSGVVDALRDEVRYGADAHHSRAGAPAAKDSADKKSRGIFLDLKRLQPSTSTAALAAGGQQPMQSSRTRELTGAGKGDSPRKRGADTEAGVMPKHLSNKSPRTHRTQEDGKSSPRAPRPDGLLHLSSPSGTPSHSQRAEGGTSDRQGRAVSRRALAAELWSLPVHEFRACLKEIALSTGTIERLEEELVSAIKRELAMKRISVMLQSEEEGRPATRGTQSARQELRRVLMTVFDRVREEVAHENKGGGVPAQNLASALRDDVVLTQLLTVKKRLSGGDGGDPDDSCDDAESGGARTRGVIDRLVTAVEARSGGASSSCVTFATLEQSVIDVANLLLLPSQEHGPTTKDEAVAAGDVLVDFRRMRVGGLRSMLELHRIDVAELNEAVHGAAERFSAAAGARIGADGDTRDGSSDQSSANTTSSGGGVDVTTVFHSILEKLVTAAPPPKEEDWRSVAEHRPHTREGAEVGAMTVDEFEQQLVACEMQDELEQLREMRGALEHLQGAMRGHAQDPFDELAGKHNGMLAQLATALGSQLEASRALERVQSGEAFMIEGAVREGDLRRSIGQTTIDYSVLTVSELGKMLEGGGLSGSANELHDLVEKLITHQRTRSLGRSLNDHVASLHVGQSRRASSVRSFNSEASSVPSMATTVTGVHRERRLRRVRLRRMKNLNIGL